MNKVLLAASVVAVLGMASCKEKGPLINFGGAKAVDTSYTAAVETQQNKVVLIEEFTGCSCSNCPAGHTLIYGTGGLEDQHPDQIAVIGYHILNFPQSDPVPNHAKYDFRTQKGTDVGASIYNGVLQMPIAGIDRQLVSGSYLLDKTLWAGQVNTEIGIKPPVNLHIASTYDSTTHKATVTVKIAYTQAVAKKQSFTLAIVESNIVDAQEDGVNIIDNYTHRSVLRDIITPFYGDSFLDSVATKQPGLVYQRTYTFNTLPAWNANNCALVAFVHDNEGTDKQVLQALEVNLK